MASKIVVSKLPGHHHAASSRAGALLARVGYRRARGAAVAAAPARTLSKTRHLQGGGGGRASFRRTTPAEPKKTPGRPARYKHAAYRIIADDWITSSNLWVSR